MATVTDAADPLPARGRRGWTAPALEAIVALSTAGAFVATSALIRVNPMDRVGQVSGLAALELRFFLFGIALVGALIIAQRLRGGRGFDPTSRLVFAAIAGLATGIIAGGVLVALRGTPWGLNGKGGDAGALAQWAAAIQRGESTPPTYPPLALHVLARYASIVDLPTDLALKHLQIIGTAVFGPVAYLAWRLLLRPFWALAIGVIAMLPLIEPYKPFPNLVLVVFVPLAIVYLQAIRDIASRGGPWIARAGVGFGAAFGVMCLSYSGWFQWAAPGLLVATLVVFPWRTAPKKAVLLLAITGAVFLLLSGQYLAGLLFDPAGKIADTYIYFDVHTEPMYIAMFRNDTPGVVGVWPPLGELGGVGLYTMVLLAGLAMALVLGRTTAVVIGAGSMMLGAWLLRFYYARMMWETKLVQLYPRTTPLILYCLLIMTGFAIHWWIERAAKDSPLRGRSALVAVTCALLLFFGSVGSATSDRYMPSNTTPPGAGWLAWNAQQTVRAARQKVIKSLPQPWLRRTAPARTGAPP